MKAMKKNQHGFSILILALIVVIAGLIGLAGWAVIGKEKSTGNTEQLEQIIPVEDVSRPPSDTEKEKIDKWLSENNLNTYGDSHDINYMGGTPLFNEATGERKDRYEHIIGKFPHRPWNN